MSLWRHAVYCPPLGHGMLLTQPRLADEMREGGRGMAAPHALLPLLRTWLTSSTARGRYWVDTKAESDISKILQQRLAFEEVF